MGGRDRNLVAIWMMNMMEQNPDHIAESAQLRVRISTKLATKMIGYD